MTQDLVVGKIKISTLLAFVFGVVFLLIALAVKFAFPIPIGAEMTVQVPMALAAAAITAGIPGLFHFAASSPGKGLTVRVTGSFVAFLIVLALHSSQAQTVAVIEATLIFFTPLLIRHVLRKYRVRISKPAIVLLSTLMVVGVAAFFSETAGARLPDLPSAPPTESDRGGFTRYDLVGSKSCDTCRQNLWVREPARYTKVAADSPDGHSRLDVLLEVEWKKWEDIPMLERDYQGHIYFTLDYACRADQVAIYGSPKLVGYSLKPGKGVLSWLIGFVEIPFLLNSEMVNDRLVPFVQEELLLCP